MTDIEVIRDYVGETVGWSNINTTSDQEKALAALDSLEAELARLTKERDAVDRDGTEWRDACWKAEAELAQVREERDHNARTAVELDRQLVQVREERDAARNHLLREGMERDRYREALERIAREAEQPDSYYFADLALAALKETER